MKFLPVILKPCTVTYGSETLCSHYVEGFRCPHSGHWPLYRQICLISVITRPTSAQSDRLRAAALEFESYYHGCWARATVYEEASGIFGDSL